MADTEATIINNYKDLYIKSKKGKKDKRIPSTIIERVEEAAKSEAIISKLFADKGAKKK